GGAAVAGGLPRGAAVPVALGDRTKAVDANQAAKKVGGGHHAGGVALRDRAVVVAANKAADKVGAGHCTGRVALRDRRAARPGTAGAIDSNQPAHHVGPGDRTGRVAPGDRALVEPDQAAGGVFARDCRGGVTLLDRAAVRASQATRVAFAVHYTGGVALLDRAEVRASQATHVAFAVHYTGGVALFDRADVETDQAANHRLAPHAAARQADIADRAAVHAEQADGALARSVDRQAADQMAQAVEGAGEGVHRIAPRTGVPARGTAGIDVGAQTIALAGAVPDRLQLVDVLDDGVEVGAVGGGDRCGGQVVDVEHLVAGHADQERRALVACVGPGVRVETAGQRGDQLRRGQPAITAGVATRTEL